MISEARMYLRLNSYFYQIGSNPVADQAIATNHVALKTPCGPGITT